MIVWIFRMIGITSDRRNSDLWSNSWVSFFLLSELSGSIIEKDTDAQKDHWTSIRCDYLNILTFELLRDGFLYFSRVALKIHF